MFSLERSVEWCAWLPDGEKTLKIPYRYSF